VTCFPFTRFNRFTLKYLNPRSKEGLPLVGFKYRKADDWLYLNSKQEGVRLVGFKYQKGYDWLDLNSKQEGVRLVGFRYQKGGSTRGIVTGYDVIGSYRKSSRAYAQPEVA
jgi:hypothetical protein